MRDTLPSPRHTASTPSSRLTDAPSPQFSGVVFHRSGTNLSGEAEENDAAIRASLISFKHRLPGQAAEIGGPDTFRLKAWAIAAEVGVPLKGPGPAGFARAGEAACTVTLV